MKSRRTLSLFALCAGTVFTIAANAQAQCPPVAPTGINPVMAPMLSVNEGASLQVSAVGGGPVFEWDADCDGLTPARGDGTFGPTFNLPTANRDGSLGASMSLCVRSVNLACAAGMQRSADFRASVALTNADPVITTNVLPNGAVGAMYSFAVQATDPANPPRASAVNDPLTWVATGLPAGLTINAATGVISGTPTAAGEFAVRVTAVDGDGGIAIANLTLNVTMTPSAMNCPTPSLLTSGTIAVSEGGINNVSARLAISQCRCVVAWDRNCDGTTDQFGASYTLSAEGADGPSSTRLCVRSVAVGVTPTVACVGSSADLTVNGAAGINVNNVPPTIAVSSLPNGAVGSAYAAAITGTDPANPPIASGIQDTFTWSATGTPPGLSVEPSTGVVFGTPTMAGTFSLTVTVRDDDGGSTSRAVSLVINSAAPSGTCPAATLISPGPQGIVVAEGGRNTVNTVIAGDACGCTVEWDVGCDGSSDGTGASFNVSGVDRDGASTFTLCHRTVPGGGTCTVASSRSTDTVTVNNVAPTITTMMLPPAMLDAPYTATVSASDPANPPLATMTRDPLTWSAVGLPAGLSINAMTGVISGTPDSAMGAGEGCSAVVVTVDDGDGATSVRSFDFCVITVAPRVCPTPAAASAFTAVEGAAASLAVSFGGADACGCEVAWDFNCDGVIDTTGLMASFSTAGFDGPSTRSVCWIARPTAGGMCNAPSARTSNALNVSNAAPVITTTSLPNGDEAMAYSATVVATDAANPPVASTVQDPLVFSLTGAPAWLSINAMTGQLTGTPPAGSNGMSFSFTVSVTDGDMGTTSAMLTLTIGAAMDGGTEAGVPDASADSAADAEPDAAADVAVMDASDSGVVDTGVRDTGVRDTGVRDTGVRDSSAASDASGDASADGGMVSGDGSCACRVPAGPVGSTKAPGGVAAMATLSALATALVRRRRSRSASCAR